MRDAIHRRIAAWSYGDIEDLVLRMAGGLAAGGLERGERVFIRMGNSVDYALVFFAANAAGLVPVTSSPMLSVHEAATIVAGGGVEPLKPGETGLLAVHRSDPGLLLGYWNRPDEERSALRGEWFLGGDLATMDDDGYIWFQGRNDDLMNALGYRVSPQEVEKVLLGHPAVAETGSSDASCTD